MEKAQTSWKVEEKPQAGYFHVETVNGTIICRVPNYDDAQIIAAAPDMLKVLKAIHAHLVNGDRCYTIMAAMAEQAMAKVKGE